MVTARQGSQYDEEDPWYTYFTPTQTMHPALQMVKPLPNHVDERLCTLEDKFKSMEVHDTNGIDVVNMCLVNGLVIPPKFKVPDFEKYMGVSCPRTHLQKNGCIF